MTEEYIREVPTETFARMSDDGWANTLDAANESARLADEAAKRAQAAVLRFEDLPTKVGSLVANIYGKLFFLTDKGWVGISGHCFYPDLGYSSLTVIHEGTEDKQ